MSFGIISSTQSNSSKSLKKATDMRAIAHALLYWLIIYLLKDEPKTVYTVLTNVLMIFGLIMCFIEVSIEVLRNKKEP